MLVMSREEYLVFDICTKNERGWYDLRSLLPISSDQTVHLLYLE